MKPYLPSPTVEANLDLSPEARAQALPDSLVSHGRQLLAAIQADIPQAAHPLAQLVCNRLGAAFAQEARALARRHQVQWEDIVLANISYDLLVSSLGCSTIALPGPSGPVLARNMDWMPEDRLARASALFRCTRGSAWQFSHAGWSASLGVVSGLSAKGFGLVINAVGSPEGANPQGYPVLLFLRHVLENADSFTAALTLLTEQSLAASGMITLVGTQNEERVVIERTPTRHALRWGEADQPLLTTNHYLQLFKNATTSPCSRFQRLMQLLQDFHPQRDYATAELLAMLTDGAVRQAITAQHLVLCPARQQFELFVPAHLI